LDKILEKLFMKGHLNFREVSSGLQRSPKTVQKELKQYMGEGLVLEESETPYQRGKPKFYSLTKRGEDFVINDAVGGFGAVLGKAREYTASLVEHPERLDRLQEFLNAPLILEAQYRALREGRVNIKRVLEDFEERGRKRGGLLTENLRNLHEIFLAVHLKQLPKNKDFFIGFPFDAYGHPVTIMRDKSPRLSIREKNLKET
jgi:DNA-binding transcriptional ArsR family regulator